MNRRNFIKTSAVLALAAKFGIAKEANKMKNIILHNGVEMPPIGYGTWKVTGSDGKIAIANALKCGYKMLDSASYYRNEEIVGEAVRESGIKRSELFINTKMGGENDAESAFEASNKRLNIEYIDLYLLHWSVGDKENLARWKVLEKLYKAKKVRAIGVSNYNIANLEYLMKNASIKPMVNQIEISPFVRPSEIIAFCEAQNIALQAYTPLGNLNKAQNSDVFKKIANAKKRTVAQIMLRWSLQHNYTPLPKSSNLARMRENLDSLDFVLDDAEMRAIDDLI